MVDSDDVRERDERELRAAVLPLLSVAVDGEWTAIGTAFVVRAFEHHALLVTAAHNVAHFLPAPELHVSPLFRKPIPKITRNTSHSLYAMAFEDGRNALADVLGVWLSQQWDLAIMHAHLAEEHPCRFTRQVALDSTPLLAGAAVSVVGYAGMTVESGFESHSMLNVPLLRRTGTVLDVEHSARGPVAQLSCAIDSGMSGGPVLDCRSRQVFVRAVARSDISLDATAMHRGGGASCATQIWPIVTISMFSEHAPAERGPTLLDAIREGVLLDVGNSPLHVDVSGEMPRWNPAPSLR